MPILLNKITSSVSNQELELFQAWKNPVSTHVMGISIRTSQTKTEEVYWLILFYGRQMSNVLILNHQSADKATKRSYWSHETRIYTLQQFFVSLAKNVCMF